MEMSIEYFISIGDSQIQTVSFSSLTPVTLPSQTRCYLWLEDEGIWRLGRIDDWDNTRKEYQIELPGGKNIYASEQSIYVRCRLHLREPTPVLAMKGQETPYFHKARSRFIQNLIEQRAASQGITGLLSANIKLYRHQVEVIRRVLEDPIQRYLLADEVGLGKTIEAAVILRQFLLDQSTGRALILVPQHLLAQWRQELEDKIYLSRFGKRVDLVAVEDWRKLQNVTDSYHFLIIDEAHHIASMSTATNVEQKECFETCRYLAHRCDRLLLLSATPVLNHEQEFLAMLHLLDPITYQLENIEEFREKVEKRQEIGQVLLAFKEDAKPFILKRKLKQFKTLLANDVHLLNLIYSFETSLQNKELSPEEINQQVRNIRTHISETYRLHRRMLRNQRSEIVAVLDPRQAIPKEEYGLDERSEQLSELLDEWRTVAPRSEKYQAIFLILFQASSTWLGVLESIIEARLQRKMTASLIQDWGEEKIALLTETPYFDQEQEILQGILEIIQQPSENSDRVELLKIILLYHLADSLEGLSSHKSNPDLLLELIRTRLNHTQLPKLVIFTSYQQTGEKIVEFLSKVFGEEAVASHLSKDNQEGFRKNLERFGNQRKCCFLVSDSSGEEGNNLQFADGLIHFDIPLSPNRLEQRLGRLDRIGGKGKIQSWILLDSEDTPQEAWYKILKKGFNIFNESIAGLQFYVDAKLPELHTLIFEHGLFASSPEDLDQIIQSIQEEIEQEKIKISEQTALDEIDYLDETSVEYFDRLIKYDSSHKNIGNSVETLLCNAFHISKKYSNNRYDIFSYSYSFSKRRSTLIPISDIEQYFIPVLGKSGTYNRDIANQHSNVSLYRLGEGLIDNLASYVQQDDRGRAFAMWRWDENWDDSEGGEWLGFRFDYVVELDFDAVNSVLDNKGLDSRQKLSLKRHGDALFPPFVQSIFLDINLQKVEDKKLLSILKRPYNQKSIHNRDYNLAKNRLPILDEFIEPSQWKNLCYQARKESEQLLRTSLNFMETCQQRTTKANQKIETRINQLNLRLQRQTKESELSKELAFETELKPVILRAIENPKIQLDAIGFIIISGRKPSEQE
jgi:ATP-dependent helicase HepA